MPDFIKTFAAGRDWPGLLSESDGVLSRLVEKRNGYKQAASDLFSKREIDELAPSPGYFMIHQIVMGDQETYGENNNGDAWPRSCLEKYHPTFVTHGHVYREHKNSNPKHKIGDIKAAKYSPKNGRVETIKHVEIAKAEKEYEQAKQGKDIFASQASKVPSDLCSICNHEARYTSLYCDDLKYRMRQWHPEQKKYAFAINPIATFFDDSIVANPAAREARHIEFRFGKELAKAASENNSVISGGDRALADNVRAPSQLQLSPRQFSMLQKLAAIEAGNVSDDFLNHISHLAPGCVTNDMDDTQLSSLRKLMPSNLFRKMASRMVLLPFDAFVAYSTNRSVKEVREDEHFKKASCCLPSIFRELADQIEKEEVCGEDMDMFEPADPVSAKFDPEQSDYIDKMLQSTEECCSIHPEPLRVRSLRIIVKKASCDATLGNPRVPVDEHALLYAMYKLAALAAMPQIEYSDDVLCALAVLQNNVEKV